MALEEHFVAALAACRGLDRVTLAGRVPPSLALRLASQQSLTVKLVSKAMATFMKTLEKERRRWEGQISYGGTLDEDEFARRKTARFPPLEPLECTANVAQEPHFVLVRKDTPGSHWMRRVDQESSVSESELGRGMLSVEGAGALSDRSWEDVARFMDHSNHKM
ncbi:hypothetical protein N658DRAFT_510529 [Parathielavia hyrcaniae]|uniref:Uncharacterized protein n=1 Tax=Parathielavia hyrcaniae TaxID=113614 RepID=A0AAN6PT14_9PEZI|nr:hypothetical protein N658DRAFT_510529 [Parathielavia hyrcaniae]